MSAELIRFKNWVNKLKKDDTLLVHFYINRESIINDPPEFFIFNAISKDKAWQVKGTTGHGKKWRGRESKIPVLNCWKVNDEFIKALKNYYKNQTSYYRYRYAIVLSANKLRNDSPEIVEVQPFYGEKITPSTGWRFDVKKFMKALMPFNKCTVVRARIPICSGLELPILRIPQKTILGCFVQYGEKAIYQRYLRQKGMEHVKIFCL